MKKDELQRRLFEKLDSLNDSNIYSVVEKEALEVNGKKIDYEILVLYQKENAHYTLVFSDKNPNGYTEFETRNLAIFYKGCNRKVMPFCIEMKDEKKIYRYNYRFLLFNEEEGILFSEFIDDCENNDSENYERYCSNKMVMEMVEDLVHIFKYPDRNR